MRINDLKTKIFDEGLNLLDCYCNYYYKLLDDLDRNNYIFRYVSRFLVANEFDGRTVKEWLRNELSNALNGKIHVVENGIFNISESNLYEFAKKHLQYNESHDIYWNSSLDAEWSCFHGIKKDESNFDLFVDWLDGKGIKGVNNIEYCKDVLNGKVYNIIGWETFVVSIIETYMPGYQLSPIHSKNDYLAFIKPIDESCFIGLLIYRKYLFDKNVLLRLKGRPQFQFSPCVIHNEYMSSIKSENTSEQADSGLIIEYRPLAGVNSVIELDRLYKYSINENSSKIELFSILSAFCKLIHPLFEIYRYYLLTGETDCAVIDKQLKEYSSRTSKP